MILKKHHKVINHNTKIIQIKMNMNTPHCNPLPWYLLICVIFVILLYYILNILSNRNGKLDKIVKLMEDEANARRNKGWNGFT